MLSLARSRYTLIAQLVFLAIHFLGLTVGIAYNASTPDLYPNNAHHKIGWIATVVVTAHVLLSLFNRAAGAVWASRASSPSYQELRSFIPVTRSTLDTDQALDGNDPSFQRPNRTSYDSGHGTDRASESLRSNSISTIEDHATVGSTENRRNLEDVAFDDELLRQQPTPSRWHWSSSKLPIRSLSHGVAIMRLWYNIVDRIVLPFGFVALCTGIVTFGRFFVC